MMRSYRRSLVVLLLSTFACSPAADRGNKGGRGGTAGEEEPDPTGGKGGTGGKATGGAPGGSGGGGTGGGGMGGTGGMAVSDCVSAPSSLLCKPTMEMPASIKATGLFPMAPDLTKHSPRMISYVPDPPLWSDGMEKDRFILLPEGMKIDNTGSRWVFPIGTIFIKTFVDDSGPGGKPRAIETRFIRRVGDDSAFSPYDYYLYEWNAEGTDATLIINDKMGGGPDKSDQYFKNVKVTINHTSKGVPLKINNGLPFDHTLPSQFMCRECHEENGNTFQTFIGFDEVRLDKAQLDRFDNLFVKTGKPQVPVQDPNALLLKVKRFIQGNCVHCHNKMGKQVDLHPDVFVANTVGKPVPEDVQSVKPPPGWLRVFPGDPGKSVLFVQARRAPLPPPNPGSDVRLRPMPPIGVNDIAADQEGIKALEEWILSLKK